MYYVRCFKADGTEAWASPQIWSFIATPNPIDLGNVVPASPSGSGLSGGIVALLETNGTPNGSQTLLNLQQGTGVTLTDNGSGQVTIASTGAVGTVTHTGALTSNALILGDGAADISAMSSLGTTTTVLHGNAGGAPSFGSVTEGDISLTNNTTNDVSITQHGFAPKLPNDATKFLNGIGTYTSAGSGTVTNSGTLSLGQLIVGDGTTVIKVGDLSGDVTTSGGTATVVGKILGKTLNAGIGTAGAGQNGYVISWVNGSSDYELVSITSIGNANAIQIQGVSVSSTAPLARWRQSLVYIPGDTDWEPRFQGLGNEWAAYATNGATSYVLVGIGDFPSGGLAGSSTTAAAESSTAPAGITYTSGASAGNNAAIQFSAGSATGHHVVYLGTHVSIRFAVSLVQTTNCRIWVCLQGASATVATAATAMKSDTPNTSVVGFLYDSATTSGNWNIYTGTATGAGNQTSTPASPAGPIDTNPHVFEIAFDGTNAIFYIDEVKVGSQSATMPATTAVLYPGIYIDNLLLRRLKFYSVFNSLFDEISKRLL